MVLFTKANNEPNDCDSSQNTVTFGGGGGIWIGKREPLRRNSPRLDLGGGDMVWTNCLYLPKTHTLKLYPPMYWEAGFGGGGQD